MNKLECQVCLVELTQEDITNLRLEEDDDCSIRVCKNHYCLCLPDMTPNKWIEKCGICDKYMCKSCGGHEVTDNLTICDKCYHVIERYKFYSGNS